EEAARSDALWEEIGNPGLEVNRYESRGEGMTYLGRFEEAERAFRRGVEIFDSLGETGFNSTMTALHASALCRLGRFDEAQAEADRSRDLAAQDDFASQVQWRSALAWVRSARGEHEEAIRLIVEATEIAAPTDYLEIQAGTAAVRGLVMRAAGRSEEARSAFEDALARYERKGAVPLVRRIRDELATLPPATA
ncbi:MAG: tetratricopeptide repeat protein, partial [Solirubrobacterales bacterium]